MKLSKNEEIQLQTKLNIDFKNWHCSLNKNENYAGKKGSSLAFIVHLINKGFLKINENNN